MNISHASNLISFATYIITHPSMSLYLFSMNILGHLIYLSIIHNYMIINFNYYSIVVSEY